MEKEIIHFIGLFTSILYEAMPFIVLGAVIAGILEEMVPQQAIARLVPRSRPLAIALGCLLGLAFPMCECGIVPVMRRLLRKGLPLSCCVAYMTAGPIINLLVIFSTTVAFIRHDGGLTIIVLRVVFGFLVAFGTGMVVERQFRKYGYDLLRPIARPPAAAPLPHPAGAENSTNGRTNGNGPPPASVWQRVGNIAATALHDFVDITVFLIIGALLAATVRFWLSNDDISYLSTSYPVLMILGMMGLAILLCLCSEADAFVAASFTTLNPAGKLAFLVLGPMLDLKLYMMFTRVFRPRLIWTIVICVVVQVFIYSLAAYFILPAPANASMPSPGQSEAGTGP